MKQPLLSVRAIVLDRHGRILLLKRKNTEHGNGKWSLPGGKVEYNQSPERSIVVEVGQETGLHLVKPAFLFYQNSPPGRHGSLHCVNLYFEGTSRGKVTINRESSEFAWVSPDEALRLRPVFGGVEAIRRYKALKNRG
jgi:8-oxo-dGTP diphosphatase